MQISALFIRPGTVIDDNFTKHSNTPNSANYIAENCRSHTFYVYVEEDDLSTSGRYLSGSPFYLLTWKLIGCISTFI